MKELKLFIGEEAPCDFTGTVYFEAKGLTANRKEWYLNGLRHREDGPAIEDADGRKEWYLNGKRHRIAGPAIEKSPEDSCKDDEILWFIMGKTSSEEEHRKFVDLKNLGYSDDVCFYCLGGK